MLRGRAEGERKTHMRVRISQLAASINESPTLRMLERARRLRVSGVKVVNLAAGEPENLAPRPQSRRAPQSFKPGASSTGQPAACLL